MELTVDLLRQVAADSRHRGYIFDTGAGDALQTAKLLQQPLTTLGADTRDVLQHRPVACS